MEMDRVGVCSWSLQVKSIGELQSLMTLTGATQVQIACGDPHHASWEEGEDMPAKALDAGLHMTGTMLGFPGEDYTTPQTIQKTGGFGDPDTRSERLERFQWAIKRTKALGLKDMMLHAGFIPEPGDPGRKGFLEVLAQVGGLGAAAGLTIAFETGQETARLLSATLKELNCSNLKVNFDPANMLLYDMGNPVEAVEILAPYIRSVHLKDANRPKVKGAWGEEVPLGQGQVNFPLFLKTLKKMGFNGPMSIEREVGDQQGRLGDIQHGVRYLTNLDI